MFQNLIWKVVWCDLCHLWRVDHLPSHSHHCQHLQQAVREGQDQGPDHQEEEDGWVGGHQEGEFVKGQESFASVSTT